MKSPSFQALVFVKFRSRYARDLAVGILQGARSKHGAMAPKTWRTRKTCQSQPEHRNCSSWATGLLQYHLQQASQFFHMKRWILQDRNVSIVKRLRHLESVVSSVACFAGGHRTMYNPHLARLDTHFRKLCRSIVGPPPGTDWTLEWNEVLHQWNVRMNIYFSGEPTSKHGRIFVV